LTINRLLITNCDKRLIIGLIDDYIIENQPAADLAPLRVAELGIFSSARPSYSGSIATTALTILTTVHCQPAVPPYV